MAQIRTVSQAVSPKIINLGQFIKAHQKLKTEPQLKELILICAGIAQLQPPPDQMLPYQAGLQKIVTQLAGSKLKKLPLQDFVQMLRFAGTVQKLTVLNAEKMNKFKRELLSGLQRQYWPQMSHNFSLRWQVFCTLLPLEHTALPILAEKLHEQICSRDKLTISQAHLLLTTHHTALSSEQKRLLKFTLSWLEERLMEVPEVPLLSLLQIWEGIALNQLKLVLSSQKYRSIIDRIEKILKQRLKQKNKPQVDHYLLYQAHPKSKSLYQSALYRIFKDLLPKVQDQKQLMDVISAASKMQGNQVPNSDVVAMSDLLLKLQTNPLHEQKYFEQKGLGVVLLPLIQNDFFNTNVELIQKLVTESKMEEMPWNLVYHFSVKNWVFPLQLILSKIKPKTTQFAMDTVYLKSSISLAVQNQLQQSIELKQLLNQCKQSIAQTKWDREKVQWLLKECLNNFHLVSSYHRHYGPHYLPQLIPTSPTGYLRPPALFKTWMYLMHNCQITERSWNTKCRTVETYVGYLIQKMKLDCLQQVVRRELRHMGQVKPNLFVLLTANKMMKGEKWNWKGLPTSQIIRLMLRYFENELSDIEHTVVAILCTTILQHYESMNPIQITRFNTLLALTISSNQNHPLYEHYVAQLSLRIPTLTQDIDLIQLVLEKSHTEVNPAKIVPEEARPKWQALVQLLKIDEQQNKDNISILSQFISKRIP